MTLRQSIARRVAQDALFAQLRADIASVGPDGIKGILLEQTIVGVSKPQADMIAAACGACTLWRSGYYMAAREFGQVQVEIHFVPLITEACDANVRSTGGEG
jgi:hypothetical protein